ncbi:MAG: hypothetical protein ACI37S_00260 [Candidatus Gastranaerophilaceae bacterium]
MWEKMGHIYSSQLFQTGYSLLPFVDVIDDKIWRIHCNTRTKDIITYPTYVDVEAGNPKNIIKTYEDKPLMEVGKLGTYDRFGFGLCSMVKVNNKRYAYTAGWNRKVDVPYALNIGLVVSDDGGNTYHRIFDGPVIDRNPYDPIFVSAPCVIEDDGIFRLYYISATNWKEINGHLEAVYVIKMAESKDGIRFETNNHVCINSTYEGEALGRPWVIKDEGIYKMWFSTRGSLDFRKKEGQHYTITYAESNDGINWQRKPEKFNLTTSSEGWDSEMIEYCSVIKHDNKYFMFYNGNGFGKTGFGYAILEN